MTRNTYNHLQTYTDGSGINGQVGAAAVSPAIKKAMQLYMGDETISTIFAAELQGIRLALDITLAEWERGERRTKVTIYTDNQAAIRAVGDPVGRSGAYILGEIVNRVNRLQSQTGIQIEIRWILLHTDI
jgi:ribonuclease HI